MWLPEQGWNVLGNLLDLGNIAFAPASPAVLRLVDTLLASHELLSECALTPLSHSMLTQPLQLVAGLAVRDEQ